MPTWLLCRQSLSLSSSAGTVTQLLEARDTRTLQRLHKQLERLDLLLLDELGYVPFSKAGAELLFEVVSRAQAVRTLNSSRQVRSVSAWRR